MYFVKTFDTAYALIKDVCEKSAGRPKISEERLDSLKEFCSDIDKLITDYVIISYTVEVDDAMRVTISLECDDFTAYSEPGDPGYILYSIAEKSQQFRFYPADEDRMAIDFVFGCICDTTE